MLCQSTFHGKQIYVRVMSLQFVNYVLILYNNKSERILDVLQSNQGEAIKQIFDESPSKLTPPKVNELYEQWYSSHFEPVLVDKKTNLQVLAPSTDSKLIPRDSIGRHFARVDEIKEFFTMYFPIELVGEIILSSFLSLPMHLLQAYFICFAMPYVFFCDKECSFCISKGYESMFIPMRALEVSLIKLMNQQVYKFEKLMSTDGWGKGGIYQGLAPVSMKNMAMIVAELLVILSDPGADHYIDNSLPVSFIDLGCGQVSLFSSAPMLSH